MKKILLLSALLVSSFVQSYAMDGGTDKYFDVKIATLKNKQLLFEIKDLVSQLSSSEKAQLLKIVCSKKSTTNDGEITVEVIGQCNCRLTIGKSGNITTPLHVALSQDENRFNILYLVKILIRAGSDVHVKNGVGITPYCQAVIKFSSQEVMNCIVAAGASRDLSPLNTTRAKLRKVSQGYMNF